ncbi:MAG: class I SAM-dependent methyltransferase [Holophagales bacterium]|nr:class I SAM-dependent methyltransferase [Holophagales bacterium]
MGTNDYGEAAVRYALRGITGTDGIAFRWLAERIAGSGLAGDALDLGCGSGRSTRFLKGLGLDAWGVDISQAMVGEARRLDPGGTYLTYPAGGRLPFEDAAFHLVLSTWVVLELGSRTDLEVFVREAARVLRPGGKGFLVTNTADFYGHRWATCEVDFPENAPPLRSGQRVKARLLPERVVVTDVYRSDRDYRDAFAGAGLRVEGVAHPVAAEADGGSWLDETRVAPWAIYEVGK